VVKAGPGIANYAGYGIARCPNVVQVIARCPNAGQGFIGTQKRP
jgi:hypothetical protein